MSFPFSCCSCWPCVLWLSPRQTPTISYPLSPATHQRCVYLVRSKQPSRQLVAALCVCVCVYFFPSLFVPASFVSPLSTTGHKRTPSHQQDNRASKRTTHTFCLLHLISRKATPFIYLSDSAPFFFPLLPPTPSFLRSMSSPPPLFSNKASSSR